MQVAGDKAAAILGVGGGVSSAGAGAETTSVVRVGAELGIDVGVGVGTEPGIDVGVEVGIDVGADVRIGVGAVVGMEVGADVRMELVVEVGIASSGKSSTMKGAGCSC
jgi:hypothetical protein